MVPTKIPKNTPTNTTFILVLPICGLEGLEGLEDPRTFRKLGRAG